MALVNTLAIRLEAITAGFTSGMNKATGGIADFVNKNRNLGQTVRNLNATLAATNPILGLTAVAATAVGGALATATAIGARYADSINTVSKRTGFATDALSRLKFIAEQTETSFEDLANGLKFLNKNLGEAQAGNKTAAKAFSDLKVDIFDANDAARSNEAVFNDVRTALAGIDNDARRAALATAIFGRGAFGILPFLRLTTQEIDALGKRAENLGLIVSEDFAKQGDAFGDNLGTIKAAALGLNNIIAQRLLPGINAFLERIIAGAEQVIPRFRVAFDRVVDAVETLGRSLSEVTGKQLPGFRGILDLIIQQMKGFNQDILVAAFAIDKMTAFIQRSNASDQMTAFKATGNRAGAKALEGDIARLNQRLTQSFSEFVNLKTAFNDVTGASSSTAGEVKKLGQEVTTTTSALAALIKTLESGRDLLEGGSKAAIDFANSLLEIGSPEAIAQYNALITKLIEMGKAGDDAAARAARALIGAEGPEFPPEEQARREAELRGAGPQIPGDIRGFREEELRRQRFDVGPEVPEHLERIPNIFGEIILATQEAKAGFASLTNFAGGIGDALAETALGAKKAFADFFKSALKQLLALIAKALVLKTVMSLIPGLGGFLGALGFDDPGNDTFAQREGARFGQLFARGLRSTFGQTAFAGISANPGTAQVVIEPQIVVQNAGPLARVEWFEKGQQQRLKRREEELGGLSR